MNDRQIGYLVERLGNLPPPGRRRVTEFWRFEEEKTQSRYAQIADYQEQEYIAKLEKMQDLKKSVVFIAADVRDILETALPKDKKALLTEFELLTFFIFLANYKPYCLFNEKGSEFKMAKESIGRVFRLLAKLKQAEKGTERGRHDKS